MGLLGATYPWHISGTAGGSTLNMDVIVTEAPSWDAPVLAGKMFDPTTGYPTLMYRVDGADNFRTSSITFLIPDDSDKATTLANLETFYAKKGPWTLADANGVSHTVVVDPTTQKKSLQNMSQYDLMKMAVQEV